MTIQTEMAIVPFRSIIQPVPVIERKVISYSGESRSSHDEMAFSDQRSDRNGFLYGRIGKESKTDYSLGNNIDIYI